MFGGERVPITGRVRGSAPDIDHPVYSIEVKCRKNHPALIEEAMDQAQKSAGDKLPIVILHKWGQHHENDYVVMKVRDFLRRRHGTWRT